MAESRVDSVMRAGGLVSSCEDFDGVDVGGFAGADRDEFVLAGGDAGAAAVNFEPAGFDEDAAFGLEGVDDRGVAMRVRRVVCSNSADG